MLIQGVEVKLGLLRKLFVAQLFVFFILSDILHASHSLLAHREHDFIVSSITVLLQLVILSSVQVDSRLIVSMGCCIVRLQSTVTFRSDKATSFVYLGLVCHFSSRSTLKVIRKRWSRLVVS